MSIMTIVACMVIRNARVMIGDQQSWLAEVACRRRVGAY
jgi:hypothetical protein